MFKSEEKQPNNAKDLKNIAQNARKARAKELAQTLIRDFVYEALEGRRHATVTFTADVPLESVELAAVELQGRGFQVDWKDRELFARWEDDE